MIIRKLVIGIAFNSVIAANTDELSAGTKTDEFMSAYIPKEKDKLYNLTNFTGSNGMVIVYADGVMNDDKKSQRKPLFITDSRYKLQASLELDKDLFDI